MLPLINSTQNETFFKTLPAIKAINSEDNEKGYITVVVKNKIYRNVIALIDTGNSLSTHGCIRADIARDLDLPIIQERTIIGTADSEKQIETIGNFFIGILLEIQNKLIPFKIKVLII